MIVADKAKENAVANENADNASPPPHALIAQDPTSGIAGQQRRLIRRKVFSAVEPGQNQRIIEHPFTGR